LRDTSTNKQDNVLLDAIKALYYSANWSADRPVDEALLWSNLRDAAGLDVGNSPAPLAHPVGIFTVPTTNQTPPKGPQYTIVRKPVNGYIPFPNWGKVKAPPSE
jgi:hypothetical protein